MHRHHLTTEDLERGDATLDGEDARHLQSVLRVRPGDCVEAFDGRGNTRLMRVAETGKHRVRLVSDGDVVCHAPPAFRATLFAAACKPNRMDWLVEKATELGAWRVVAVAAARCVARGVDAPHLARWRRIAREALRQCGGAWEPEISGVDFNAACGEIAAMAQRGGAVWFGDLSEGAPPLVLELKNFSPQPPALSPPECGWCVGPEGDFTPAEMDALRAAGAHGVSLGQNVLRAETAGVFGLCAIHLFFMDSNRKREISNA
ncbi:MAG: 16S rRNA (uracil(1498)-N(3))-methyltransferase [Kiritimatiellaeota bacterium]|nr:16S rRNA (uracil(1498)-N(3))-methyltransferase [Kiritimatiellota bacterium]